MRLIRGMHNLRHPSAQPLEQGCVATIGNFDGVHRGHQVILGQLRERAAERRLPTVVIVFEPQPREFFQGERAPARLMRFREKLLALQDQGIDYLVCLPFNSWLRNLTAEEFVQRILVDGLHLRHLVVGDDFRFGCDRSGDFNLLASLGARLGFGVEHTQTIEVEGSRVSSTRVREALAAGDLALAERLLGRPYTMCGRVVHGQKLGRQLGVPTANLLLARQRVPLSGVFAVRVHMEGLPAWPGVANVGVRPTVNGNRTLLEVHLLDFAETLYGRWLEVEFRARLRDEIRFPSLEALKAQIAADIEAARGYFKQQAN